MEALAAALRRRGASVVELEGACCWDGSAPRSEASSVLSLRHRSPVAAHRQRNHGGATSHRATPRGGRERVLHTRFLRGNPTSTPSFPAAFLSGEIGEINRGVLPLSVEKKTPPSPSPNDSEDVSGNVPTDMCDPLLVSFAST